MMDLSFSGAGFMGCYYFGVVDCWNKYIPRDRVRRVAGASAGSLIAAYYLIDLKLEDCLREIMAIMEDVRSRPLGVFDRSNQIVDVLPRALDKMFPDDAHKRVNGRLFVSMTRLKDMKNVTVNEFETRQDLIDALNCSCFIPVWSGNHVSTYKGVKHIDGGFTNNLPVFDEHTIRISCFSGGSDIAPLDRQPPNFMNASLMGLHVNLNWKNLRRGRRALWPPPPSYIMELLERGYHDTKCFILSNDLIKCNNCYKLAELEYQPFYLGHEPPTISPRHSRSSSIADLTETAPLDTSVCQRSSTPIRNTRRDSIGKAAAAAGAAAVAVAVSPAERRRHSSATEWAKPSSNVAAAVTAAAIFARRRSKTGRQITMESLELASQVKQMAAEAAAAAAAEAAEAAQEMAKEQTNLPTKTTRTAAADKVDKSFVKKLREKLQRRASCKPALNSGNNNKVGGDMTDSKQYDTLDDDDDDDDDGSENDHKLTMPTIVIEQALRAARREEEAAEEAEEAAAKAATTQLANTDLSDKQLEAIWEHEATNDNDDDLDSDAGLDRQTPVKRKEEKRLHKHRNSTSSDATSSVLSSDGDGSSDSAVGFETRRESACKLRTKRTQPSSDNCTESGDNNSNNNNNKLPLTPTANVFAPSRVGRRESLAMVYQLNVELERQQRMSSSSSSCLVPDRFSFAPSQLPSCPPSPNLNRHCTECIRMRQEARLDQIDEVIRREAEKYSKPNAATNSNSNSNNNSDDNESITASTPKEFKSIRYKLSNLLRQFGGSKYRYSFDEEDSGLAADAGAGAGAESDDGLNRSSSGGRRGSKALPRRVAPRRRASELPGLP